MQPTFPDGPPVPLMTEGTIEAATLRQLAADLQASAEVLSVREKAAPGLFAASEEFPLVSALERLCSGAARSVQIRYRYDGREWTDTLFALGSAFRVVRCRHDPLGCIPNEK